MAAPGSKGFSSIASTKLGLTCGGAAETGRLATAAATGLGAEALWLAAGVGVVADAGSPGAATFDAAPIFLRSLMFWAISAARLAASLVLRSCADWLSADLPWIIPFESVSLSGAVASCFLSSTLA